MLAWVGYSSLRNAFRPPEVDDMDVPHGRKSYMTGLMIALLSPMGIVYWLSVGAALVAEAVDRSGTVGAPVLVGGVFLGLLAWVTVLSVVAQISRRFVTGPAMRWITGLSGVLIVGFAIYFLYQGIQALN
jgi:threonine/homoserine/homoserine lactone efflux protein